MASKKKPAKKTDNKRASSEEYVASEHESHGVSFDKNHTSTAQKVVIVFFAVILVVSMCLPFFSSCSYTGQSTSTETSEDSAEEASTSTSTTTVASVQSQYSGVIANLQSKLDADPENTTAMASLGNNYMDMAGAMKSASDYADNTDVVTEAYTKAAEYYDMYLAVADSQAVHVDRDVCWYYADKADDAIADLEEFTQAGGASYAMAWFNLGVMYYGNGDYQSAVDTFQSAIDLDSDGSMGVASSASLYQAFAQSMLDAAAEETAAEESADATDDGSTVTTDTTDDATSDATDTTDGTTAEATGSTDGTLAVTQGDDEESAAEDATQADATTDATADVEESTEAADGTAAQSDDTATTAATATTSTTGTATTTTGAATTTTAATDK